MKKYIETEGCIMASATDKQKDSLKEYMKKNTDISIADESLRKMINECNENSNPILIKFRLK